MGTPRKTGFQARVELLSPPLEIVGLFTDFLYEREPSSADYYFFQVITIARRELKDLEYFKMLEFRFIL